MAGSDSSTGGSSQPPKTEAATDPVRIWAKFPRRQLTLAAITVCLNILLWTSVLILILSLYLIACDPNDTTTIPTHVLTLSSVLLSIAYVVLHTIFSLKQRIWRHQRRHPAITKRTTYFAVRVAGSLCALWLLTSGWNMITVARRPTCMPAGPGLDGWEAGSTCVVGRVGIAFSFVALIATFALFGMLAVLTRPFEAHVFKSGYQQSISPDPSPHGSRRSSQTRNTSFGSERFRHGRVSASTHRSTISYQSNTDVETLDLNAPSGPSTIHAPLPMRSIGLGIFTSQAQPPPLPAAFLPPSRTPSNESQPSIFQPSTSQHHLPLPPRMSALVTPSGFIPGSVPAQFSASAWRAVHPTLPSPLGPTMLYSNPHLPHAASGHGFSYRTRYSRSSISLTRPNRLSTATPTGSTGWSSRSGSTGPGDEGRGSPTAAGAAQGPALRGRASSSDIAYAILSGTFIPGTELPNDVNGTGHIRRSSAPDTTGGAKYPDERMAKGWKPRLPEQPHVPKRTGSNSSTETPPHARIPRSSSADLLTTTTSSVENTSKFSPDSSPDEKSGKVREGVNKDFDSIISLARNLKDLPFRKSRSAYQLTQGHSEIPAASNCTSIPYPNISKMPQDPIITKRGDRQSVEGGVKDVKHLSKMAYDELKNKPLPRIAAL